MVTKNDDNWLAKYTALREHVEAHGHLTDRHTQLNHWWKYQKKKRKEGKLTDEQERLLDELLSLRSTEHAGGVSAKLKFNILQFNIHLDVSREVAIAPSS